MIWSYHAKIKVFSSITLGQVLKVWKYTLKHTKISTQLIESHIWFYPRQFQFILFTSNFFHSLFKMLTWHFRCRVQNLENLASDVNLDFFCRITDPFVKWSFIFSLWMSFCACSRKFTLKKNPKNLIV